MENIEYSVLMPISRGLACVYFVEFLLCLLIFFCSPFSQQVVLDGDKQLLRSGNQTAVRDIVQFVP